MIRGETGAILNTDARALDKYNREKQLQVQIKFIIATLGEIKSDMDLIKRVLNVKNNSTD
jgi:hypothetical protein